MCTVCRDCMWEGECIGCVWRGECRGMECRLGVCAECIV